MALLSAFHTGDITIARPVSADFAQVVFSNGSLELLSQTIMGNYPDYRQIIPNATATNACTDREHLLLACKLANVFARLAMNRIFFDVGDGQIVVRGAAAEVGDGRGVVDAQIDGEPVAIAFNAAFVLEALQSMDSEQVELGLTNSNSPGTLRPVSGGDQVCVIMPMNFTE